MPLFQRDFEKWIASRRVHLNVAFAFPEPSDPDNVIHLLFWTKGKETGILEELKSDAFVESDNDDDDELFHIFGGDSSTAFTAEKSILPRRTYHHASLAGYMRLFQSNPTAPAKKKTPPMIGVFRRAIRPGTLKALATSFQPVCNIWYETVPGILAAMVTSDPTDENYVYDVRIFADKASYDGHVDKTNAELVRAMETWFANYDTSIPHTGSMFAEDTSDPALHTSSIQDRPVKVDFNIFHYGRGGCMGQCCFD